MCTEKCFELKQTGSSVTRRAALVGGAAVAASAVMGGTASAGERGPAFSHRRHGLRDLTYPLTTTFPAFAPGEEAVRRTVVTIEADGYYMQEWRIIEHIGTHVDAPGHFTPGGRLSPELRPSELITPAVVIDIADRAAQDPDTVVTVDTLSIDPGTSTTFETHLILTGADRYGLENLANLDRIPKRGATIMVGLIPYEEGSGGQARIFATW
jgi:kynurenine formamidase